jgi:hypothetical protein
LVLLVFNKYPASSIDNPLQFLCILLAEMACYQPDKHIISIYGLREADRLDSSNTEAFNLPVSILDKFSRLDNPTFSKSSLSTASPKREMSRRLYFIHPVNHTVTSSLQITPLRTPSNSPADIFQYGLTHVATVLREIHEEYQIQDIPFTFDEKLQYLINLLGYSMDNEALDHNEATHPSFNRFGDQSSCVHSFQQLSSSIAYCHMINKGIICDSSLLFAVIQAIEMKGALPVGEVGKVMSIHGDAAALSKFIKDRFGGLKKYLERFPLLFVFGDDHEYNPHVFLTSLLSEESKAKIDRHTNTLSMEYMVRHRQVSTLLCLNFLFPHVVRQNHRESYQSSCLPLNDKNLPPRRCWIDEV